MEKSNLERLLKALKVPEVLKNIFESLTADMDEEHKKQVMKNLYSKIGVDRLVQVISEIYEDNFTEEDFKVMADFYETPTGQKSLDKAGKITLMANTKVAKIIAESGMDDN